MRFQSPEKINPPPTQDQVWGGTQHSHPHPRAKALASVSAIEDGDFDWLQSYTFELWCEKCWARGGGGGHEEMRKMYRVPT